MMSVKTSKFLDCNMKISKILKEDFDFLAREYNFSSLFHSSFFVTGSTGLIGKQIVLFILYLNETFNAGISIYALARTKEKVLRVFGENAKSNSLTFIYGDLSTFEIPDEKIDYIIHGASITSSKDFVYKPVETIRTAVDGTLRMLEVAYEKKVRSFVYLSSMEVFGVTDNKLKSVKENDYGYIDIMNPRSSYSESKRLCECLCSSWFSEYGLPVKIARLTQVLGPGIDYNDTRVAAQFARSVIESKNIVLKTEGKTKRPVLYTRDAVSGIFTILMKGDNGQTYTVANPETFMTIKETAELIIKEIANNRIKLCFDIDVPKVYAPDLNLNLNVDKLKSLGWLPSVDLKNSYSRMISDLRS